MASQSSDATQTNFTKFSSANNAIFNKSAKAQVAALAYFKLKELIAYLEESAENREDTEESGKEAEGEFNREDCLEQGIPLWVEPSCAGVPQEESRIYAYQDIIIIETVEMKGKSLFLIGRDERFSNDFYNASTKCSCQYTVIQFVSLDHGKTRWKPQPVASYVW